MGLAEMIIAADTSALMAVILNEPERQSFIRALTAASAVYISAPTLLETLMVAYGRRGNRARALVRHVMDISSFQVVSADTAMAELAYDAFEIYGKGSGHPAQLNFGDTFSYALAKIKNVPLLFKGDDFSRTDVQSCLPVQCP